MNKTPAKASKTAAKPRKPRVGTKVAKKARKRSKAPKVVCMCGEDHPFRWSEFPRPSIFSKEFAKDASSQKSSKSSTALVEKARANGKMAGTIKGISRSREEELLRLRQFAVFSLAKS